MPDPLLARRWALSVFIVSSLLASGLALVSLFQGVDLRVLEQHRADADTVGLEARQIAQSFVSPRDNLSSIDVELGTIVSKVLPGDGHIRLIKGDGVSGTVIYEAPLNTAIDKNPYLRVSFPPLASSRDLTYTVVLDLPRPLKTAIGVHYNTFDALSSGQMYIDGRPTPGDIAMNAYYRYDLSALRSDLKDTVTNRSWMPLSWLALLLLPGLALLVWLPNGLTPGQRLLAAPGLSILTLPVLLLTTRALGIKLGTLSLWAVLAVCGLAILLYLFRPGRNSSATAATQRRIAPADFTFWALLTGVLLVTITARLIAMRDLVAGMNLDAYHHTLIAEMFIKSGGIPSNYIINPSTGVYAPLASFTYHFGFHALTAAIGWLTQLTGATDMLTLMPLAGQIATALPVLTLTAFCWRVLGDRWAGLAAGALVGCISIFPAYYVNWSRYTQGLGLTVLPIAWLFLIEAINWRLPALVPAASPGATQPQGKPVSWGNAANYSGPFVLAVITAAGLALTHYRIAMVYAAFVALYLAWVLFVAIRQRKPALEILQPVARTAVVALLTLAAWSPWLVNLAQNFGARFVGKTSPVGEGYYSLDVMGITALLQQPSVAIILLLSLGGIVWAVRRRDPLPLLPALTWLLLGLWSNPYFFPGIRLPYAGYLDATTLATGAWLPVCVLAGYSLSQASGWLLSLAGQPTFSSRAAGGMAWLTAAAIAAVTLIGGLASAVQLATLQDIKPYMLSADLEALNWMRTNLPRDAYVLANPFAWPWDAPPQAVQGSDSGLWVPLIAEVRSSVPPVPAYNERLADPAYIDKLRAIISAEPFDGSKPNFDTLKAAGITHIFIGSRGGALSPSYLLNSDRVDLRFHRDAVWLFEIR